MRQITIFFWVAASIFAQTDHFEAASVKMAPPDLNYGMTTVQGGVGEKDSTQVTYRNISITNLLGRAYGPHASWQIAGPNWLDTQRYDVIAKLPEGTTKEGFKTMLQNLLTERFGMKLHQESREFKAYNLVVTKDGPKLKASVPAAQAAGGGGMEQDSDGFPILNHKGMTSAFTNRKDGTAVARMVAKDEPVSILLASLSQELKAPVADQTGLTGTYDFRLEYTPFILQQAAGENGELQTPGLVAAIKTLGLGVVETKAMQDVLVIEHIERTPTEN